MIEIEIPTTKRVKLYYSGKESENKGKKRFIGDKPYHYRLQAPHQQEEDIVTLPTTRRKCIFGCQECRTRRPKSESTSHLPHAHLFVFFIIYSNIKLLLY
jgi:hypothetical protein